MLWVKARTTIELKSMFRIDQYFAPNQQTLQLRNTRLELISQNIANAATPNYRARDIDFSASMAAANQQFGMSLTQSKHIDAIGSAGASTEAALVYRVPLNPSLDNNTVEIGVEQAKFGRAAAEYQASLQFLENRISSMRKALRGE